MLLLKLQTAVAGFFIALGQMPSLVAIIAAVTIAAVIAALQLWLARRAIPQASWFGIVPTYITHVLIALGLEAAGYLLGLGLMISN